MKRKDEIKLTDRFSEGDVCAAVTKVIRDNGYTWQSMWTDDIISKLPDEMRSDDVIVKFVRRITNG